MYSWYILFIAVSKNTSNSEGIKVDEGRIHDDVVWQAVLGEIELSISSGSFITWFKNTRLLRNTPEVAVIGVNNIFGKQQLELKYNQIIRDTLAKNGVTPEKLEYKIHSTISSKRSKDSLNIDETVILGQSQSVRTTPSSTPSVAHTYRQGLNEKYVFDSFVVGGGSELAFAACQAIADHPGTKYNPLFVYGGVGIGKTHLIQAVGNEILRRDPSKKIV